MGYRECLPVSVHDSHAVNDSGFDNNMVLLSPDRNNGVQAGNALHCYARLDLVSSLGVNLPSVPN